MGNPLVLLILSLVFAGFVWLNFRAGYATLSYGVEADRRRNPIGFWLIQAFLGSICLMGLYASLMLFLAGAS